jgi:hypothetical protein
MNITARFVHALITQQPLPETSELTAMERAVLAELHPLLQAGLPDISEIAPEARGWTIGMVPDADRSVA